MIKNKRSARKGKKQADAILLSVPEISGKEWKYVKDCLDTGWVSSVGSYVDKFERDLAGYVGVQHAVATVSGTAALHVALQVAGVEADDEVLVSTLTFIAPVNAIRYLGAWPVLIDCEPDYWQMDPAKVEKFLDSQCQSKKGTLINKSTGRRVKAILPVHILGHPVDMQAILDVACRYDLPVIEDASESLGASYKGKKVGSLADMACFSFNGNKLITTGGGGMIATGNKKWADRAKYLTTQAKDDPIEYIHNEIGYNYRLTNVQAAIGCAQLEQLDDFVSKKRAIAETYSEHFAGISGLTPIQEASWAESTCWMYTVLVDEEKFKLDSRGLLKHLSLFDIQARPLWQPMHRSAAHRDCQAYECKTAGILWRDALSLPCSVGLDNASQLKVCEKIILAAKGAAK